MWAADALFSAVAELLVQTDKISKSAPTKDKSNKRHPQHVKDEQDCKQTAIIKMHNI